LKQAAVPNLNVAGWFDQEDFYGPLKIYETLEKLDSGHRNYLVVGPWNHGGWSRSDGRSLGKIDFGSDTGVYFRARVQAAWFAYWLKDRGKLDLPEALTFQTGSNEWQRYDEWPPRKGIERRKIYFQASGALSFDDYLIGEQQQLMGRSMAEKEVYLGVQVQTRRMVDRAVERAAPVLRKILPEAVDAELAALDSEVEHLDQVIGSAGLEGRPVHAEEMSWLMHRSCSLGLPAITCASGPSASRTRRARTCGSPTSRSGRSTSSADAPRAAA